MIYLMFSINDNLLIVKCHSGAVCVTAEISGGGNEIIGHHHYVKHPAKAIEYQRAGWEVREL